MQELTDKQKRIVEFLKVYVGEHGFPPTMREIGEHFGFTWPAARGHLAAIEKKGAIRMNPMKSRGIEVIGLRPKDVLSLPVAGRIRAGKPLLAIEEIESHIVVDRNLFKEGDSFVLRVTGDSMVDAGILHGDYVVVKPQREIRGGDIGVVLIGEEATVKKVYPKRGSITLVPANKMMEPVTYRPDEVSIVGKVIGVIRKF
ncbi:MAG TPA: transcriptional repressor LexA [Thermodesulfovibrionales bacterium]|nr:transcriptional repressor LexA [Thermodesulfovibrionales bacterium]